MPIANPSRLKYPTQRVVDWALNLFPLRAVSTATITSSFTAANYPRSRFVITGATNWSSVRPEMFVIIRRAGSAIYHGSVRRVDASDPTSLYLAGMMYGDTGQAREQEIGIDSGDVATIYDVRVPWAYWSRIDIDTDSFFKRWNEGVYYEGTTISKTEYPLPVANLGPWQRGQVDAESGVATLTHSAAGSKVWRGSGFTVQWHLPAGAALASGYSITDATIEVEYAPGIYLIGCTVTEVGGASPARARTGWRYVWAVDGVTVLDTSDLAACEILSDDADYNEGRSIRVRVSGTNLSSLLYTGAPVLMTYRYQFSNDGGETWVNVPESDGAFSGYVTEYTNITSTGDIESVEVLAQNPLGIGLTRLGIYEQLLRRRNAGNEWTNTIAALCNAEYFVYYLIDHHASWMTIMHDFDATELAPFSVRAFRTDAGKLTAALQRAAGYCLGATVGCTSDGAIVFKRDPRYESNTYNSALDMRWTIDDDHVRESLVFARSEMSRVYDVQGNFFISGTTRPIEAYIARTNSGAPAQGTDAPSAGDFIALDLADGLARVGHFKAAENSPTQQIEVRFAGMQDVIDPCRQGLYTLNLSSVDALNTGAVDGRLFVARRVSRTWQTTDTGDVVVNISAVFVPVTRGVPARTQLVPGVTIPTGGLSYILIQNEATPDNGWGAYVSGGGEFQPDFDWGWEFDFRASLHNFNGVTSALNWVSGQGLDDVLTVNLTTLKVRGTRAVSAFGGAGTWENVRAFELDYTAATGIYNPSTLYLRVRIAGSPGSYFYNNTDVSMLDGSFTVGADIAANQRTGATFDIDGAVGWNTGGTPPVADPGGNLTYHALRLYGVGSVPSIFTTGSAITPPGGRGYWSGKTYTQPNGLQRRMIDVQADFTPPFTTVTAIRIFFDLTIGTVVNPNAACIQLLHTRTDGAESVISTVTFAQAAGTYEGTGVLYEWRGRLKLQGLRVRISSCLVNNGDPVDGFVRFLKDYELIGAV
jgi:hypothetical protein